MGLGRRNRRWKRVAVAAVALVLAALFLEAVERRRPGAENPVNHGVLTIAGPFLRLGAWVGDQGSVATGALRGARELREENERLRAELQETRLHNAVADARRTLSSLAQDVSTNIPPGSFDLFHAPVIANPVRTGRQQVWVAVGSLDGIREGMVALGPQGIAGMVTDVFERTARVSLLTDDQAAWGAQVAESGDLGLLRGTGHPSLVEMHFERTAVSADVGDLVVSSGMAGSLAPAGMQFGVVEEVTWNKKGEPVALVRLPGTPERLRTLFIAPLDRLPAEAPR